MAYESFALYKEKMKRWKELSILKREFSVGDSVMLYNSRMSLFPKKLKSKWSGPFKVTEVLTNSVIEVDNQKGEDSRETGKD